jgi:hypothetical protein
MNDVSATISLLNFEAKSGLSSVVKRTKILKQNPRNMLNGLIEMNENDI